MESPVEGGCPVFNPTILDASGNIWLEHFDERTGRTYYSSFEDPGVRKWKIDLPNAHMEAAVTHYGSILMCCLCGHMCTDPPTLE